MTFLIFFYDNTPRNKQTKGIIYTGLPVTHRYAQPFQRRSNCMTPSSRAHSRFPTGQARLLPRTLGHGTQHMWAHGPCASVSRAVLSLAQNRQNSHSKPPTNRTQSADDCSI